MENPIKLGIGLMSGTSLDGIDAALVEISGSGKDTKIKMRSFLMLPYAANVRAEILRVASGECITAADICLLNFHLGKLFANACEELCIQAKTPKQDIDFIGSHGQTVWHAPTPIEYLGAQNNGTLQIGEAAVIAQQMGCTIVSDFRVRDMAAGGFGAPLVPYTEFLLYKDSTKTVALQNIGGIGNITLLPAAGGLADILAFDTGPGNMVMDAIAFDMTNGVQSYDKNGLLAAKGQVHTQLLKEMMQHPYLDMPAPKTTGREMFGQNYVQVLQKRAHEFKISDESLLATATQFTAESIAKGIALWCKPYPQRLIIGGGGSRNPILMEALQNVISCEVVTNEALGYDSDAKEAVAFAILANETLAGNANNAPAATGASGPVVMGKITPAHAL